MSKIIQDNPRYRYAVTVCKAGDEIVGHLPRNISTMCSIFIRRGGIIYCTVLGRRNIQGIFHRVGWKFAGKLSRLEANPRKARKFSTANDLHYTVIWNG